MNIKMFSSQRRMQVCVIILTRTSEIEMKYTEVANGIVLERVPWRES